MSLAMAMASSSVLKRKSGATGPKVSSRVTSMSRGDVGQHRRLEEGAAERMALAAGDDLGALGDGVGDMLLDLFDRRHVDQRALVTPVLGAVARPSASSTAAASFSAKAS